MRYKRKKDMEERKKRIPMYSRAVLFSSQHYYENKGIIDTFLIAVSPSKLEIIKVMLFLTQDFSIRDCHLNHHGLLAMTNTLHDEPELVLLLLLPLPCLHERVKPGYQINKHTLARNAFLGPFPDISYQCHPTPNACSKRQQ